MVDVSNHRFFRSSVAAWAVLWALMGHEAKSQDELSPPHRQLSSLDRMTLVHLEAAHSDVVRIERERRTLSPTPGYQDFRAILHAHAEDSSHTGGTRAEMLADAKRADVHVILLTNHHRPPVDFITDNWHGIYEGVLFIPGSEARGFLLYPTQSILASMDKPAAELLEITRRDRGLAFLSHIEERPDHSMEGLDGMEIYNRHADAKKDAAGIVGLLLRMTDPESLRELEAAVEKYPDELLATQNDYPADYLAKWDRETLSRRLTGVAANDCHHNQVLLMKVIGDSEVKIGTIVDSDDKYRSFSAVLRPGIRKLTQNRSAGDVIARLDLDPYFRSFRNSATHLYAPELSESAIRFALREGHGYVSHDWMCDPTGFSFVANQSNVANGPILAIQGDETPYNNDLQLIAEFPARCLIRLIRSGKTMVHHDGERLAYSVQEPGVYRIEGWLTIDGEPRPWIYSNPIYVRQTE